MIKRSRRFNSIVSSHKQAKGAKIEKLGRPALLSCSPGLADGSLHVCLCVLVTYVVLLLLQGGFILQDWGLTLETLESLVKPRIRLSAAKPALQTLS